jgi:putative ABC transport system permease protein
MSAWRNVFQRAEVEREMDEEMRFHIDMEVRELMLRGVPEAEAQRRALIAFGGVEQQKEHARDARFGGRLDELKADLHFGVRWLRRSPAFTSTAVLTLALGIGSGTVIFGAADHVLLRPLPYADPERLITLWETDTDKPGIFEVSPGNFLTLKERAHSYEAIGLAEPSGFDLIEQGAAYALNSWSTTEGFAEALGIKAAHGRLFAPSDYVPGAAPVVVISHDLWRNRFNSDVAIVGRALRLDNAAVTVIGVLPADLPYPERRDVWAPKTFRDGEEQDRNSRYQVAAGRLKRGVSLDAAQQEAAAIAASMAAEYPRTNSRTRLQIKSVEDHVLGNVRLALLVLAGAVACLLLIACANIANLLLARGLEREREVAIRAAIGAGRRRIARQMLTESALLCALGGALGIAFAYLGVYALKAITPPDLPRIDTLQLDARLLIVSMLVTGATACVVGIIPALRVSSVDIFSHLRGGGRAIGSRGNTRARSVLVIAEVALAIILLTGTSLLARSFMRLRDNPLGFDPANRMELQTFLWDRTQSAEERVERTRAIEVELRRVAGVERVGATTALPFHPHQITMQRQLLVAGAGIDDAEQRVFFSSVTPDYFSVMDIDIVEGRAFTEHDRAGGQPVVMVSRSLVARFFPNTPALGQRIALRSSDRDSLVYRDIVGVVNDVRATALDAEPQMIAYTPQAQSASGSVTFVARIDKRAAASLEELTAAIWRVDPGQAVYHSASVERLVGDTVAERRFHLIVLGVFSVIGLLLALIGIYGLITFIVRTRMKEFGLRFAIGAGPRDIVSRVLRDALRLTGLGVLAGVAGALLLSGSLQQMLYEVDPADPLVFLQTALFMMIAALFAALLPALRAASAQPLTVLRED